jgi:histidinol phosphatase-like PHP family hydrolase
MGHSALLSSVHEFENARDVERIVGKRYGPERAFEDWRDYFRLQQLALESDFVPFQVLAHPVRMSRGVEQVPPELDLLLLDLAKSSKRRGKALELNGNDVDYAPQLVRRLAKACSEAGCMVSLGSDSHHPRDVYKNIGKCGSLVAEFNLGLFQAGSG